MKILYTLLFALFFYTFCQSQGTLDTGLVAHYPFNGNANDISGNNNNPIFNNATFTADRFGNPNNAYHFNGVDNYIQISNSSTLNTNNTISLSAWVNVAGFYQGPCHGNAVIMKGHADYLSGNYLIRFNDGAYTNGQSCSNPLADQLHQNFMTNFTVPQPGYTPYIQTNQWYNVVYTYDGTTEKLYVDCQLKGVNSITGLSFTNGDDLFFGRMSHPQYPYWFNGDLDEVRIYNRALTAAEIGLLCSVVTPVKLQSFTASFNKNKVTTNWQTANEINTSYFNIQRSDNGKDFITVGKVDAKGSGNYLFDDNSISVNLPIAYYRLEMVDKNNSKEYSQIVAVKLVSNSKIKVFPNPANHQINISRTNSRPAVEMLTITDIAGKMVKTIQLNSLQQTIDISHLENGVYLLSFENGERIKMIKQ